jgi:hypothetical protein
LVVGVAAVEVPPTGLLGVLAVVLVDEFVGDPLTDTGSELFETVSVPTTGEAAGVVTESGVTT